MARAWFFLVSSQLAWWLGVKEDVQLESGSETTATLRNVQVQYNVTDVRPGALYLLLRQ